MELDSATLRAESSAQTEPDGAPSTPAIRKGTVIGRYVVLREVGRGGMGAVYAAYDPRLDRRVALKLLLDRNRRADALARLLREAQSLARLSHPNVVAVHDVGEFDDRVFVAMEFVEGTTLRQWQRKDDHSWRDTLALYRQAAQGLAAAHAAGVVHRDFKPENVMLADDGRVKVMDFGLARAGPSSSDASPDPDEKDLLTLTRAGTLMGTPAYMSPEQFQQRPIGPASDQFSFCVALHEGLVGVRPFAGTSLHELAATVAAGRIRDIPRGAAAPRWLMQVVRKGLALRPEDRHASMEDLLAALDRGLGRRRRLVFVAGGVGVVGLFLGGTLRPDDAAPCRHAAAEIRSVWTPGRAAEIESALVATGHAFARETWQRARTDIDAFVEDWIAQHDHVCGAWKNALPADLLALRSECLAVQRSHLEALLDAVAAPTVETVALAAAAAASLPRAEECAQIDSLETAPPPEWADEILHAQQRAAHARVRRQLGDTREAENAYGEALAALHERDAPRVRAQILAARADLRLFQGEVEAGEADLVLAQRLAAQSGDAELVGKLWLERIVQLNILHPDEIDRQEHLLEAAELAVLQAGEPPVQVARLAVAQGIVAMDRGDFAHAREHLERGVALAEEADAMPSSIASYHDLIGQVLLQVGDYDGAQVHMARAVEIVETAYGPAYPSARTFHGNLGGACLMAGDHDCAREHFEAVTASLDAAGDRGSVGRAHNLAHLAELERQAGRPEIARGHAEAALEVWRGLGRADSLEFATTQLVLHGLALEAGRLDEALERAQAADAIHRKHRPADHPESVSALSHIADALAALQRHAEALAAYERVQAVREATLGPTHEKVAIVLGKKAEVLEAMGRISEALAAVRSAAEILRRNDSRAELLGEANFIHARLLWASGDDPALALELARRALRDYDRSSRDVAPLRAAALAWLAARDAAPDLASAE